MKIRFAVAAFREAENALAWYEMQRPGLGEFFEEALHRALDEIANQPRMFPRVETLRDRREIRHNLLRSFPYNVIYEALPDEVVVLAIAHVRRRPNYWARRKS